MTTHRRSAGVVIVGLTLGQVLGCAPAPAPVPTPTPAFASEAEAFAAAEEVYRAYNDALNERREGAQGADPQRFLTGIALESDVDTQNLLSSSQLHATGAATLESFTGETVDISGNVATMTGVVCIDVSAVALLDNSGADVTPPDRDDKVAQRVRFLGTVLSLLISEESTAEGSTC